MSEQNILNPTAGSDLNPDYSYTEGLPNMMSQFQAKSGKAITRQLLARGRVYQLAWNNRAKTIADQLRQWEAQYRADFFSYFDQERQRYFSGRFAGPPQISPAGWNKWNIQAQFVEIPGFNLFAYPANWFGTPVQDSIFMEENLIKLSGSWVLVTTGLAHAGFAYNSNVNNDIAEWLYYGYGFKYWSFTQSDRGIVAVSVDGGNETNVDLYTAGGVASSALFTTTNLPLGLHRVKVRCTHTKNVAASDVWVNADAIEVMQ